MLAQRHDAADSPYLPIGAAVEVAVGLPATATAQDAPIATDGRVRWMGWQDASVSSAGSSLRYLVPENWSTALSSSSADYEPGSSIRGVVLTLTCETGPRQFAFAFRTDPARVKSSA